MHPMQNKQRIAMSFARHFCEYDAHAHVQMNMARELAKALQTEVPRFSPTRAMEIGVGTGLLTRELVRLYPEAQWWFNDLTQAAMPYMPETPGSVFLSGDAEEVELPTELNLIATSAVLQWMKDLPKFVSRMAESLAHGGVLAVGAFVRHNLYELRQITGAGLQYPSAQEWADMLCSADLQLVYAHDWEETLHFLDMRALLGHLHSTGVNAAISTPLSRGELQALCEAYCERFTDHSGKLPLTYHPIVLLAKAHEKRENAV